MSVRRCVKERIMGEKTTLGIMLVTSALCLDGASLHLLFICPFRQTDTELASFTSQFSNVSESTAAGQPFRICRYGFSLHVTLRLCSSYSH